MSHLYKQKDATQTSYKRTTELYLLWFTIMNFTLLLLKLEWIYLLYNLKVRLFSRTSLRLLLIF